VQLQSLVDDFPFKFSKGKTYFQACGILLNESRRIQPFVRIGFANPDLRVGKAGLVNHDLKLIHGLGFENPDL